QQSLEALAHVARDHRRYDHSGGDESDAEDLRRGENRCGQEHDEKKIDLSGRNTVSGGDFRIEGGEKQWPADQKKRGGDEQRYQNDDPDIALGNAEDVAEERGFDVALEGPMRGNDCDAKREAGRRHHADGRVGADPAAMADPVDQDSGQQSPESAPDKKIHVPDVAQARAAEDRVRQAVTDVAHAPQDDVDADKTAERTDHDRSDEAIAEKLVFEGNKNRHQLKSVKEFEAEKIAFGALMFLNGRKPLKGFCLNVRRVGALADHHHAVLVKYDELTAVRFAQHFRVKDFIGPAFSNQAMIDAHRPGQMRGHPIQT